MKSGIVFVMTRTSSRNFQKTKAKRINGGQGTRRTTQSQGMMTAHEQIEEQADGMTIRRTETRRRRSQVNENSSLREQSCTIEQRGPLQDQQWKATEAYQENPQSLVNQGNTGSSEQAKRKAKNRCYTQKEECQKSTNGNE